MIRLETVEDFEKVAKAFKDPNSKPFQYVIRPYGFCKLCNRATEYIAVGSIEGVYVTCLFCSKIFSDWNYVPESYQLGHLYETDSAGITDHVAREAVINQLNSREQQKIFFNEKLEQFIKKAKKKQRDANKEVRQSAKLRA